MIEQSHQNEVVEALAAHVVALFQAQGLSSQEGKAILGLVWLDLRYTSWKSAPREH